MKTIQFSATLGVVAGYGHNNETRNPTTIVAKVWQEQALISSQELGIYVGSVITPSVTIYKTEWGCPEGGELTVSVSGECNPTYTNLSTYKRGVLDVLARVAKALGQSTTQVTFREVDFEYLDFR